MINKIKLSDYPINIDTICFKINAELNESCYSDWENKYKFYQTIKFVNGSRVSIRYYHFYKCLSIYIDSLPGLLYGSSQELYKYSDFPHFKKILSDLLVNGNISVQTEHVSRRPADNILYDTIRQTHAN